MKKNDTTSRILPSSGILPEMIEYHSHTLGETYYRFIHRSGMPILVFPKKMTACTAMMVVRYGAQDVSYTTAQGERLITHDTPDGVAHFLEHKLFGEEDGGTVDELFSALGVDVNAWTDYDKTAYFISATEQREEAIFHLLRFVTHPYFTAESVEREQGIIGQEIRMVEDNPWQTLHRRTMGALYSVHPVRRSICGTEASIARITEGVLYDCYYAFYRPENMYLVVCGDITAETVAEIADRALEDWEYRLACHPDKGSRVYTHDQFPPEQSLVQGTANVSRPIFQIAWKDPVYCDISNEYERLRRELTMGILSEILFSRAGLLYNRLFECGLLSPSYSYGYSTMPDVAYHSISGESDDPDAVWQEYWRFIDEQKRRGIDAEDFERCRRVLYAGYVSEFDFTDDIADLLVESEGNDCAVFPVISMIGDITLEQVQELLMQSFDREYTVCSVLRPIERKEK